MTTLCINISSHCWDTSRGVRHCTK